jgi:GNAT superfamily N-acetyltransferase
MGGQYSLRLSKVPSTEADEAFAFHSAVASEDSHIWPRTRDEIAAYAGSGQLFGIRRSDTSQFVGLCYVKSENNEWEFGGLAVDGSWQKLGLGTLLSVFVLAHTIVFDEPWSSEGQIIAHVEKSNDKPRGLLTRVGFEYARAVEVPAAAVPKGMKTNEAGNLEGDQFVFPPKRAVGLLEWLERFEGHVGPDRLQVHFDMGAVTLDDLLSDLREIVGAL